MTYEPHSISGCLDRRFHEISGFGLFYIMQHLDYLIHLGFLNWEPGYGFMGGSV